MVRMYDTNMEFVRMHACMYARMDVCMNVESMYARMDVCMNVERSCCLFVNQGKINYDLRRNKILQKVLEGYFCRLLLFVD